MATATSADERRLGLLSLPSEVRVKILRHLLVQKDPVYANNHGPPLYSSTWNFEITPANSFSAQILATCKTLRNEGIPLLWCDNEFHILTRTDVIELRNCMPAQTSNMNLVRHLHLHIDGSYDLLDMSGAEEMMRWPMLQKIDFWIIGYNSFDVLSLSLMKEHLLEDYYTNASMECRQALRALVSQRPDVEYRLERQIEVCDFDGWVDLPDGNPYAYALYSIEVTNPDDEDIDFKFVHISDRNEKWMKYCSIVD